MTTEQLILVEDAGSITPFDYGVLDVETRIVVQQRTSEIKERIQRSAQGIIEIGARLSEVRSRLEGNSFDGWLKTEFDWSRRTAYNFIGVHEQFGRANFAQLDIAASALYLLAAPSTPPEAREEAIERAEAGEKITHQVAQQIVVEHKPPKPAAPIPSLPPDFGRAQDRAQKAGLFLEMNGLGLFKLTRESDATVVIETADWPAVLAQITLIEKTPTKPAPVALTPRPAPAAPAARPADEEIAAPPPPRPAPTPLALTPLNVAPPAPAAADRKLLASKRALLAATLALIDAELAATPGPTIVVREDQAVAAGRMFLSNPALSAAAAMLAFSATVESEAA